jgi:CO/xanthine dehydrogenase Mo-binding subunit
MNDLAEEIGLDPIEFRLKNASKPGDPLASGDPWPGMGMTQVLEALQAQPAWQNRAEAKAAGRGIGIALGAWFGGIEPSAATCMLDRDGSLNVHISSVDLTGTPTTFALMAAEAFGLDPARVRVITGDTSNGPYAGATGGSKTTYTVGPSVIKAAEEARIQTLAIASEELEADPADLEIVDGKVQVRGVPDKALDLGEIAGKTMRFGGQYAPIFAHGRNVVKDRAPGFCAQLAEVEVDEETGDVKVHRLIAVQDVGRAINPLAVEGQIMGGAMQGLGWALHESMVYDDNGQLLTASLMDYTVPQMTDSPPQLEVVLVEVPAETGPFGARGVGEPPITPTAAAVANAIKDQTGVRITELPMIPQRVFAALRNMR